MVLGLAQEQQRDAPARIGRWTSLLLDDNHVHVVLSPGASRARPWSWR